MKSTSQKNIASTQKRRKVVAVDRIDGEPRLNIVLRIWDWSEWCRQVVRGVQSYSHSKPHWRLFVDVGQSHRPQVFTDEMQLDGIITHVLGDVLAWKKLIARGRTKVVSFASNVPGPLRNIARVCIDDQRVAEVVGRHLAGGGLRRLAFCGSGHTGQAGDFRHQAVQSFAEAHGCTFSAFKNSDDRIGPIHLPALARWIDGLEKPVGIITWNIEIARRVVKACQRVHAEIPDSVCIVAWDDDPMLAETIEPTISAAVIPAERLGYEAANLLDHLLRGNSIPDKPKIIQPDGLLRIRQSSDMWSLKDREVFLAMQYIREHATKTMKVPQIARQVGISRKKLELEFSRVLHKTPYEAIVEVRLDLAKRYLRETNWDAARVAASAGIGDASTLRRWFIQREGMGPNEYRARNGVIMPRHRKSSQQTNTVSTRDNQT